MVFWNQNSGLGQEGGTEEEEEEPEPAQLFCLQPASAFSDSLPFPYPKAPTLTSLAQGYPCILLGLTVLSSGLDNGHGHL